MRAHRRTEGWAGAPAAAEAGLALQRRRHTWLPTCGGGGGIFVSRACSLPSHARTRARAWPPSHARTRMHTCGCCRGGGGTERARAASSRRGSWDPPPPPASLPPFLPPFLSPSQTTYLPACLPTSSLILSLYAPSLLAPNLLRSLAVCAFVRRVSVRARAISGSRRACASGRVRVRDERDRGAGKPRRENRGGKTRETRFSRPASAASGLGDPFP